METIICLGITRWALGYKEAEEAYSCDQDPVVAFFFSSDTHFPVVKMMEHFSKWMLCVG